MVNRFEYIFEKSMLIELASNGCKKNVINRLDTEWKEKLKNQGQIDDENYIEKKLSITIPIADKPPLAQIKREGENAELLKISELAYKNKIVTESLSDKMDEEFIEENNLIVFSKDNKDSLDKLIETGEAMKNKDFKVNLMLDKDQIKKRNPLRG